jgi:hypothetical protein
MTESDRRAVSTGWQREPKSTEQAATDQQDIARQKQVMDELKVRVWGLPPTVIPPPSATRKQFVHSLDGLSEQAYCQRMQATGYQTPVSWQKWQPRGCPAEYLDAFNLKPGKLRNRFLLAVRNNERKNARRGTSRRK